VVSAETTRRMWFGIYTQCSAQVLS
jgi:hypothetical protein